MFSQIIPILLYFVSFILLLVAFITIVKQNEGSLKKAIFELLISIISVTIGCYIQFGFDYISNIVSNKTSVDNKSNDTYETNDNTQDNRTQDNNKMQHKHTADMKKKENIINPTCIKTGSYEYVIYCKCGEELNRELFTIEANGHNYIETINEPNCTDQGFTEYICKECNDKYFDNYTDALGHDFNEGICTRCGYQNPDFIINNSEGIMKILSNSVVSDSGTYAYYIGSESISVFAEECYNCFSINTAVSYNLWGGNVQNVVFNISKLNEFNELHFNIGGETGSSGTMGVEIFIDKSFDDSADYIYELDASAIPIDAKINIANATSLGIKVTNYSNNVNRLVFYNFSGNI